MTKTIKEPQSFNEAIKDQGWQDVMDREMESIHKNDNWDLMKLLVGKRSIFGKWVHKLKQRPDHVETCKTKLVARGDEQHVGIDFEQKKFLIVKWGTLRMTLALATKSNWELFHLDVKTTFVE